MQQANNIMQNLISLRGNFSLGSNCFIFCSYIYELTWPSPSLPHPFSHMLIMYLGDTQPTTPQPQGPVKYILN